MKPFILFFLLISVYCSNITFNSHQNLRSLQEVYDVYFISANNLYFNRSDYDWHFNIKYYSINDLPNDINYTVSILFEGKNSLANCTLEINSVLNCLFTEGYSLDSIKLNNKPYNANIRWKNLTNIYDIPLFRTLLYIDSYDLSYTYKSGIFYFSFKIEIDNYLPDDSLVKVDILLGETQLAPLCYYSVDFIYDYLYCNFTINSVKNGMAKILPKDKGTVDWINIDKYSKEEYFIPYKNVANALFSVFDLELIDNKWNFKLHTRLEQGNNRNAVTINVKTIKPNGNKNYYLAKCHSYTYESGVINNNIYLTCIVEGDNQDILDLVYISNTTYYNPSMIWNSKYYDNYPITRRANLKLMRIYEYMNSSHIKFLVDDNGNIPNKATLSIDLYFSSGDYQTNYAQSKSCTYENHILTCLINEYYDKICTLSPFNKRGCTFWTNLQDKAIALPKNHTFSFVKSHNLFFADKWYFLITLDNSYYYNLNSNYTVLIDITHNSKETTATCEFRKNDDMICFSNFETQSETDLITLRKYKKYGSVTWKKIIENIDIMKAKDIETSLSMTFKDAYDMIFTKKEKWVFIIYAETSDSSITKGIIKVDILVNKSNGKKIDSIAKCLLLNKDYRKVRMICLADYDNQEQTDLIQMNPNKSSLSTITWISGLTKYTSITLQTSLYLEKYIPVEKNKYRLYNITVKSGSVLPSGSKVVLDLGCIYVDDGRDCLKTINCMAINNSFILCNSTEKFFPLHYYKSPFSSVRWLNDKNDEAFYLLSTQTINLESADRLYYDNSDKKWYFNLTVNNNAAFKFIVDILYGQDVKTATCFNKGYKLCCVVNEDNQDKNILIQLTEMTSASSTLTWENVKESTLIPLWIELTIVKAWHLKFEDNIWTFDIIIKEDNIPENSLIIIDIYILYDISYQPYERLSTANCTYTNKILKCKFNGRKLDYDYAIKILSKKNKNSISTVYKWNNVNEDTIPIYSDLTLDYFYNSRIIKNEQGKYTYTINSYELLPDNIFCIVDILIGNKNYTSICFSKNFDLECEIDKDIYTNEDIYLSKIKSNESTVTWSNLSDDQILSTVKIEYIYIYGKKLDENKDEINYIKIFINEDTLKSENQFTLSLYLYKLNKEGFAFCSYYNFGYLSCYIGFLKGDEKYFYIGELGEKGIIELLPHGNYVYDQNYLYIINFKSIFFCIYDDIYKYYNYSIEIEYNKDQSRIEQFVMDLEINDNYVYGYCKSTDKLGRNFNCHSPKMEKEDNHIIKINNGKPKYGNAELRNLPYNNFTIYPNNSTFIKASKIYDLLYTSNKWEFKIKPANNINFNGSKKLGIYIDNNPDYSNCVIENNNIIKCIVNSDNQNNNQLIKIRNDYIINENIYLYTSNQYGIPLVSELEFISASDIEYNNGWSFYIVVKNNNNFNIPIGSTFSIDIKCDKNTDELAYCTEQNRNNNNELTLLCTPQSEINNNTLITLSTSTKSTYSSITWNPPLSEKDTVIYFHITLNVTKIYLTESKDQNNFYMIVTEANMPLRGKIILDLKYNNKYIIGICELIEENKFECFPDISPQNPNDDIAISSTKIKGTVTFINKEDKLKFIDFFNFVKAFGLKFDTKWEFNIELSESRIKYGKSFEIDILIDDEEEIADCVYDGNNILKCEINCDDQDQFNTIKIIKSYNNHIVWNNLPDILTLYYSNEYLFNYIYGGFYEGKWKFNIKYEQLDNTKKIYNNNALLDILVNGKESTAICTITYSSFLKCVANYENQNKDDKIIFDVNKEPILGSIKFNKLQVEPQKNINYVSFSLKYENSLGYANQNDYLEILIEGTLLKGLDYELEEDTITMIELVKYKYGNQINYDISCLTNNIKKEKGSFVYLICTTDLVFDNNKIEIKIDNDGYSKYVKFSQKTNIEILYQN